MASRPNLLFIMTDHQRADSIGQVQAGVEVTPHLNRLAGQGTQFSRAYNSCPLCAPARTALATGKYPTRNGVVCNDWQGLSAGDHKPVHQYLHEAGYAVGHIGVDHIRVRPTLRERVPFADWASQAEYRAYVQALGLDLGDPGEAFKCKVRENWEGRSVEKAYSNAATAVWPHGAEHFLDMFYCRQAVDFLRRPQEGPFALFLYLWAPHPPLQVPEPYAARFDPARIELPANSGQPARGEPANRRWGIAAQLAAGLGEAQWRRAWAAHLGLVHLADAGIGRVLQALEDSGRAGDTQVLFAADHGDHMGQHGMYQKMEMYEQAVRVPFIVRGPQVRQQRVEGLVSHLDIVPTLLDWAGLEAEDELDGRSLRACLEQGQALDERPVFSQYSGNPVVGDIRRAVITRGYKYVYDPQDRAELYDLEADPLEMDNRAGDAACAQIREELHELCRDWHIGRGDWVDYGAE